MPVLINFEENSSGKRLFIYFHTAFLAKLCSNLAETNSTKDPSFLSNLLYNLLQSDPDLSSHARELEDERDDLRRRLERLEEAAAMTKSQPEQIVAKSRKKERAKK